MTAPILDRERVARVGGGDDEVTGAAVKQRSINVIVEVEDVFILGILYRVVPIPFAVPVGGAAAAADHEVGARTAAPDVGFAAAADDDAVAIAKEVVFPCRAAGIYAADPAIERPVESREADVRTAVPRDGERGAMRAGAKVELYVLLVADGVVTVGMCGDNAQIFAAHVHGECFIRHAFDRERCTAGAQEKVVAACGDIAERTGPEADLVMAVLIIFYGVLSIDIAEPVFIRAAAAHHRIGRRAAAPEDIRAAAAADARRLVAPSRKDECAVGRRGIDGLCPALVCPSTQRTEIDVAAVACTDADGSSIVLVGKRCWQGCTAALRPAAACALLSDVAQQHVAGVVGAVRLAAGGRGRARCLPDGTGEARTACGGRADVTRARIICSLRELGTALDEPERQIVEVVDVRLHHSMGELMCRDAVEIHRTVFRPAAVTASLAVAEIIDILARIVEGIDIVDQADEACRPA